MDKKRKIYIIIALVVGMVIGLSIGAFVSYYQYDYRWIIGKHYNEIIANYGEFDSGNAEFVKEEKRHDNFYTIEVILFAKTRELMKLGHYLNQLLAKWTEGYIRIL